ncbi:MarR family winged helix-turn-helix transcriptional regulator [Nocardioides sp.]|uniref:MarR family winged helix-turn-helix transcriptional regulator n=1 Tax=Nocardioides sp. TaxID=35761 RepID=UPI003527670F
MGSPRWLTDDQQRAWRAFSVMQLRLTSALDRELRANGLSYPEYVVLAALTEHDPPRLGMSALREVLGWERSRLSHQLTRMERRGLVARSVDPDDARRTTVEVTASGMTVLRAAAPVMSRWYAGWSSTGCRRTSSGPGRDLPELLDGLPPG